MASSMSRVLLYLYIYAVHVTTGSAQFRCFTTPSSAGESNCRTGTDPEFDVTSIEECCLSPNGQFFEGGPRNEGCTPCIVFGWFAGTDITLDERADTYDLQAGFIKGGAVQQFVTDQSLARFMIGIEGRGAVPGVNGDFNVFDTSHLLFGTNPDPFNVPVTVQVDGVALEPAEEFALSLVAANPAAMQILAEGVTGLFARPEISVVVRDLETVSLQFTEVDFTRVESGRFIQLQLQLSTSIATDLIVEVTPLNLTYARDNMLLPESIDPIVTDPNFDPSTQTATSVADFSIMPVRVTFTSANSPETVEVNMEIIDDTIHEADQVFVLILEVISDVDRSRLAPQRTDGSTCLGRIIDDDSVTIGFVPAIYSVLESEPQVTVNVVLIDGILETSVSVNLHTTGATATADEDYIATVHSLTFSSTVREITVTIPIINDDIFEGQEQFFGDLTLFSTGVTVTPDEARVLIDDDDDILINRDCVTLSAPANGAIDLSDGTTFGSTATYSCNAGFNLLGSNTRDCQANGVWSGTAPACFPVGCGTLPAPANGAIDLSGGTTFGSMAEYSCNTGFNLQGSNTRDCQANGVWSRTEPVCVPVDCGTLPAPDNGAVDLSSGTTFGSMAQYSCNTGFSVQGSNTRDCQANGVWSGTEPICVPVDCGTLPAPDNGAIDLTDGTTFGLSIEYSCNAGFNLQGSNTRDCQANGIWSGTEPICVPVDCGTLPAPANGAIDLSDGTTFGSTATYSCNAGFNLQGSNTRVCQANGVWSGAEPVCAPVDCGTLPAPANGAIDLSGGTTFGSTATYSCNAGFSVQGSIIRNCQANGLWSGAEPICVPVDCGTLLAPDNGTVDLSSGTTIGSIAIYSCNAGFSLQESPTRICQEDGVWSGATPRCVLVGVTIGFEQTVYTVTEGVDSAVELCANVMAKMMLERAAVVNLATHDGSATTIAPGPVDYVDTAVDFTFGPGVNRSCVNVTIANDDILEGEEDFFSSLTTTDPDVILGLDEARIIILEDPTDETEEPEIKIYIYILVAVIVVVVMVIVATVTAVVVMRKRRRQKAKRMTRAREVIPQVRVGGDDPSHTHGPPVYYNLKPNLQTTDSVSYESIDSPTQKQSDYQGLQVASMDYISLYMMPELKKTLPTVERGEREYNIVDPKKMDPLSVYTKPIKRKAN